MGDDRMKKEMRTKRTQNERERERKEEKKEIPSGILSTKREVDCWWWTPMRKNIAIKWFVTYQMKDVEKR
jgi:hypothetical protein